MLCARLLRHDVQKKHGLAYRISERAFNGMLKGYDHALRWVLSQQPLILCVTVLTAALSVYMFGHVNKGFFPHQDTGRIAGFIQAGQDTSFVEMSNDMRAFSHVWAQHP